MLWNCINVLLIIYWFLTLRILWIIWIRIASLAIRNTSALRDYRLKQINSTVQSPCCKVCFNHCSAVINLFIFFLKYARFIRFYTYSITASMYKIHTVRVDCEYRRIRSSVTCLVDCTVHLFFLPLPLPSSLFLFHWLLIPSFPWAHGLSVFFILLWQA